MLAAKRRSQPTFAARPERNGRRLSFRGAAVQLVNLLRKRTACTLGPPHLFVLRKKGAQYKYWYLQGSGQQILESALQSCSLWDRYEQTTGAYGRSREGSCAKGAGVVSGCRRQRRREGGSRGRDVCLARFGKQLSDAARATP